MEKRTIALIVALILIAAAIVFLGQFTPNKSVSGTTVAAGNRTTVNAEKAQKYSLQKRSPSPLDT